MKKVLILAVILTAAMVVMPMSADAYYGSAFKSSFTILWDSIKLDHTYFCLNGTSDCYSDYRLGHSFKQHRRNQIVGNLREQYFQRALRFTRQGQ